MSDPQMEPSRQVPQSVHQQRGSHPSDTVRSNSDGSQDSPLTLRVETLFGSQPAQPQLEGSDKTSFRPQPNERADTPPFLERSFVGRLAYQGWQHCITAKEALVTASKRIGISLMNFEKFPPVFVFQMGKVGSMTVYTSLKKADLGRPVFHAHFLTPESLEEATQWYRDHDIPRLPEHIGVSRTLVKKISAARGVQWPVITLVRDPIEREISAFFQHTQWRYPDLIRENGRVPNHYHAFLRDEVVRHLEAFDPKTDFTSTWFDRKLLTAFGIDVYQYPFDHERGHTTISTNQARVLVIRLDCLEECFQSAIPSFLGVQGPIPMVHANDAGERGLSAVYNMVLSQIAIPREICERIYSTRYARHFFDEERREKLIERWTVAAPPGSAASIQPEVQHSPCFLHSTMPAAFRYQRQDLFNEVAGLLLAASGREDLSPELLAGYPRGIEVLDLYLTQPVHYRRELTEAVRAYTDMRRVPMLGLRQEPSPPNTAKNWQLPENLRSLLESSPNALLRSSNDLDILEARLRSVRWKEVGVVVENHIRDFFGIPSIIPVSTTLLGGFIWKNNSSDLDLTVIVEDPECFITETGGSRPHLICPGISEIFPAEYRPTTDALDAAVYGVGALARGTYSHDLINTMAWGALYGIPLSGKAPLQSLSPYIAAQNVLVTLGFGAKHLLLADEAGRMKIKDLIREQLCTCILFGEKYRILETASWKERSQSPNDNTALTACLAEAKYTALAAAAVINEIKEDAARHASELLIKLSSETPDSQF